MIHAVARICDRFIGFVLFLGLVSLNSCAALGGEPKCQNVPRNELVLIFIAEVTALKVSRVCETYRSGADYPYNCPEFVALTERHDQRRKDWVECRQ